MRRLSCGVVLAMCGIISSASVADDAPVTIPEVVYIDPAPFLPEGMDQMVDEALDDVPLNELASHIGEKYGFEVLLVETGLQDAGITTDEEVDFPAGVPLYQALAIALEDVAGTQLTWMEEDGVLKITCDDDAERRQHVQVYDMPSFTVDGDLDTQALIDLVEKFTSGEWVDQDGIGGEIDQSGDVLVIRQTQQVHLETALLLEALSREGRIIRVEHPPHHQRLFEALDQTVDIDIESQPLDQVLAHISEQLGVPIRVRVSALQDAGNTSEDLVSYHLGARSLRSVFKHMLVDVAGVELTYLIADGMFCITTVDDSVDQLELALYDVRDLLQSTSKSDLLDLVAEHTSGEWHDVDGIGGEYSILPNGYMVIRNTNAVHDEIAALLALLREKLVMRPAAEVDAAAFEVRHYYVPTAMADRLERLLPEFIAPDTWRLEGDRDGGWISRVRVPENWTPPTHFDDGFQSGGPGGFSQVPISPLVPIAQSLPSFQGFGRGPLATPGCYEYEVVLIIRQTHAVHEQIADFIDELNDPDRIRPYGLRRKFLGQYQSIRSNVLSNPDWPPADQVDPWQTMPEMPEMEVGYVDAANFVPEVMRQNLEEPIVDVPLMTVAEYISQEYGIHVSVHENQLAEAGVPSDEFVSLPSGLPLYMVLEQGLRDVAGTQLDWYLEDGILSITTFDETIDLLSPVVYDVGDLLVTNDDGQWLIDLLQDQTSGEWMDHDGIGGEADLIGNVLLVRQTQITHREIGSLLAAMRVDARIVRAVDATNAAVFETLDQPVAIEFESAPISSVAEMLAAQLGVTFFICEQELQDAGLTPAEEITYQQGERPLRQALDIMLDYVAGTRLTYLVDYGVINITSEYDAADRHFVTVYQVSDILDSMPLSHGLPDYPALIDIVQTQTSGEWVDIDGIGGEIAPLPGGRIAIRTTQAVHEETTQLFTKMRDHLTPRTDPPSDPAAVETRYYHFLTTTADDLQRELPRLIDPESWRSDERPEAIGIILDAGPDAIDSPEAPCNQQRGWFQMPGDSPPEKPGKETTEPAPPEYTWLLITQTAGTHQRITALLEELSTGTPASAATWSRGDMEGVLSEVIGR